jgi:hypothetical protein
MNPWVEQDGLWPDFHVALVPALRRQLARQVAPKYIVLLEEQIYIHELPPESAPARSIRPVVDFWPIGVRDPLPVIPVPLRAPDGDARVDLREAVDQVYDEAGYVHFIYDGTPDPPLSSENAQWARQFLPAAP